MRAHVAIGMIAMNVVSISNVIVIVGSNLFFTFVFLTFFALFQFAFLGFWYNPWLRGGLCGFYVNKHLINSVIILFWECYNDFHNLYLSNAMVLHYTLTFIHPRCEFFVIFDVKCFTDIHRNHESIIISWFEDCSLKFKLASCVVTQVVYTSIAFFVLQL